MTFLSVRFYRTLQYWLFLELLHSPSNQKQLKNRLTNLKKKKNKSIYDYEDDEII